MTSIKLVVPSSSVCLRLWDCRQRSTTHNRRDCCYTVQWHEHVSSVRNHCCTYCTFMLLTQLLKIIKQSSTMQSHGQILTLCWTRTVSDGIGCNLGATWGSGTFTGGTPAVGLTTSFAVSSFGPYETHIITWWHMYVLNMVQCYTHVFINRTWHMDGPQDHKVSKNRIELRHYSIVLQNRRQLI